MKPYAVEHFSHALIEYSYIKSFDTLKEARKFVKSIVSYRDDDKVLIYKRLYEYETKAKNSRFKLAKTFK